MDLSAEHEALRQTASDFIREKVNPHTAEWEAARQFPSHEVFRGLGDLGLLGINKPEAFGGMGLDYTYQAVFAECLGLLTSTGIALAVGVQTDMATPALARHGSDELREEFLRPSIAGDMVAAIGVSEVSGGSDIAATSTSARRQGGDYVINGGKMWTTNGVKADWICVLANTSEPVRHARNNFPLNKSLICVPTRTRGVTVARKLDKMGMHSSDTAQIFFDDVRVPLRNLVGSEGRGFAYQMKQFCDERLLICLSTIAAMRDTLEQTVRYTAERRTFGTSVLSNQAVQFRLADLYARIEAQHALAWRTVHEYVAGRDIGLQSAVLKLNTGKLVRFVNDECLQLWGGMGFMDETIVARRYRDQRVVSIGGGTDEVMLQIIAGYMNLTGRSRNGRGLH